MTTICTFKDFPISGDYQFSQAASYNHELVDTLLLVIAFFSILRHPPLLPLFSAD